MYANFTCHLLADQSKFWTGQLPEALLLTEEGFYELWQMHPPEFHTIAMFGRPTKTARWQQAYERDYVYTGSVNKSLPLPSLLQPLFHWVQNHIDHRLNGVLLNWYDAKLNHYIGAHRDNFEPLLQGAPIITISFAETRIFRLRPWRGRGFTDFSAKDGNVFIMPYETNKVWRHEVPRSNRFSGRRISVTFRAFK